MKKNLLIITTAIITILAFASCQKEPSAKFTASKTSVVTGEVITFTNATVDGYSYEWNFGDGTTSTEENPTHAYEDAGTYNVQLTSFSKNGKKSNSSTIAITVTKANEIIYDGNNYTLTKGYLEKQGASEYFLSYDYGVWLVSDGITIMADDAIGTGDMIYLKLRSSSDTGLPADTYTFDNDTPRALLWGEVGLNFNIATDFGTLYEFCTGGTVTISQSGTDYIFDVTFTLANGKTVNAYYKGAMIIYDQTNNPVKKHSGK